MKLFVWDFHGVLEKDNDLAALDITNQVLEDAGYQVRLDPDTNRKFYGLKWYQYFERLLPDEDVATCMTLQQACYDLQEEIRDVVVKRHIKPNDYASEVLAEINKRGHAQILISNTRQDQILWFVNAVGLDEHFPESHVFGVNAHQQHANKQEALRAYLKNRDDIQDIVIVGDSQGDMELKNVAGGNTFLYAHPHLPLSEAITADAYIADLREVLKAA